MAGEHGRFGLMAATAAVLALAGCAPPPAAPLPAAQAQAETAAQAGEPGCVSAVPPEVPPGTVLDVSLMESRVLAFSRAHVGQVLGSGQCAELADRALIASGAKTYTDYAASAHGDDYIWGDSVDVRLARPGDVLQFRDFSVTTTMRSPSGPSSDEEDAEHHTVVVEENRGGVMTVFESNVDDDPAVRRTHYFTASGTYPGRADGTADPRATTVVRVSGSVHAYRPQPR